MPGALRSVSTDPAYIVRYVRELKSDFQRMTFFPDFDFASGQGCNNLRHFMNPSPITHIGGCEPFANRTER